MSIRVRRIGFDDERRFADAEAVRTALERSEIEGTDEYWAPRDEAWVPLDEHPDFSTTDARGIYPTIVHAVVFVKILVFVAFLSILRGTPEDLGGWGAIYVYVVIAGDLVATFLAYTERNRAAAGLLWVLGVATFPLGLFLILSARMTRNYRLRPAE